ncbi:MAG: LytTR family DNA-binding domain-containing protein [Turicibacter sp.]|nr:LytTR family DNA-binding domain-containing protein [Turicibacter sp.]
MQRILFVEDEKDINNRITTELTAELGDGVTVLSTYTAEEARQALKILEIALMIIDIKLPDGNGIDLAREVRMQNKFIPIMIASSHVNHALHSKLNNELDVFLVLEKPYTTADLLSRVKGNLEKMQRMRKPFLNIKNGRKQWKFPMDEIIKVETIKGTKQIELTHYKYETHRTDLHVFSMQLSDFMETISETNNLVRISQSTVVNPNFILHYDGAVNELYLRHIPQVLSIGKTYRHTVGVLFSRIR